MRPLAAAFSPPPIFATDEDRGVLANLLRTGRTSGGAALLHQEFERLSRASAAEKPFVRLGFSVTYRDLRTKHERRVLLSPTPPMETTGGEVSVWDTLGAALLGWEEGAIFRWSDQSGRLRALKVLAVSAPD